MEKNLFKYVWQHTRSEQLWILAIVLASFPIYFLALDLPKRIVNVPIQGEGFEQPGATAAFLEISIPAWFTDQPIVLFSGFDLERLPLLIALSLCFLLLVCVNGMFKFYINTYKGRLGERMLRRLRYELVDRLLRFPNTHFRKVKAPEMATMIKDEVEPLGGFIGDAFVQPVFLGGQAITAMVFIITQSAWLGMISAGIVILQAFIIPRMRRRLLHLAKQRQLSARALAGKVGELVDGIAEIRTHDTSNYERADVSNRLGRIFSIRYEFYQRKFFIKFLNNFLAQVTPFLFYFVGGFLTIRGSMDIGQLVAVIAAYKDLPSPIKELIDWDQKRLDVQIKYNQVISQFDPGNVIDPKLQPVDRGPIDAITTPVEISGLGITDDTGARLVDGVSLAIRPGVAIAAVGDVNAGGESTSEALARLHIPTDGRITIDANRLEDLPESITGRRIGYIGQDTYLPNTTLIDAILYGLKHAPEKVDDAGADGDSETAKWREESERSGNLTLDFNSDWIDYSAAGVSDYSALRQRVLELLNFVELSQDVFEFGLRGKLDQKTQGDIAEQILVARKVLREQLHEGPLAELVEPFDPEMYNEQATIADNLLFGTAIDDQFATDKLTENSYVLETLANSELDETLFDIGRSVARTVIELFSDLAPDHPLFEELSFMTGEQIPEYEEALKRVGSETYQSSNPADRARMLGLSFAYIETRYRFGLVTKDHQDRIVAARRKFRDGLPKAFEQSISFLDPETYNAALSLQDNILFGRITRGIANGSAQIRDLIRSVLNELDMYDMIYEAGLEFNVGSGGKRLSTGQRQKVGLARTLVKRPDLLIVNRGLSGLNNKSQAAIIERILGSRTENADSHDFAVFWVLTNPALAELFDTVVVFDEGKILEQGAPTELLAKNGKYAQMLA